MATQSGKSTQTNRMLEVRTPLGKDFLLLEHFSAEEGISQLFSIDALLLHEEENDTLTPTAIDPKKLVGQSMTISVKTEDNTSREFSGLVRSFVQGGRNTRFTSYTVQIVPHIWLLTLNKDQRIFQQQSVPDILRKILTGFRVRFELNETYHPRNYCVQYGESDFNFISRLMEEEGIFYYFEHTGGDHIMVIADSISSHRECPGKSTVSHSVKVEESDVFVSTVSSVTKQTNLTAGKVTMWDHNFQLPGNKLDAASGSRYSFGDSAKIEVYQFPAGHARKFDGIDKGGGQAPSDLNRVFEDRTRNARNALDAIDSQVERSVGKSNCCSFVAGLRFTLDDKVGSHSGRYVLAKVSHRAGQSPSYITGSDSEGYSNDFEVLAYGDGKPPFRPARTTASPPIPGVMIGEVVGGADNIVTDDYGRVKVRFPWDRGSSDSSSCWVRVAQALAGNGWGSMFIPRAGMEVLVSFVNGDIDYPVIVGCVYKPTAMPPYKLPDEKTKSTIKTKTVGGSGYNELRFEDKAGSEQIFIHAQKDKDIRVKNDLKESILHDRHLTIDNDQFEKVGKDKHLTVGGDHNEKIGGTMSLKTTMDIHQKAGMNFAADAGQSVHIKAGMSAVIEAGVSLTLKVGGNFVNISPAGVSIKGTMVMINSGGAAGTGSGCSPEAPTEPKPAVDDKSGTAPSISAAPPPLAAVNRTALQPHPAASSLNQAAQSGTPFCEVCDC